MNFLRRPFDVKDDCLIPDHCYMERFEGSTRMHEE